jgi:hypothetical protein
MADVSCYRLATQEDLLCDECRDGCMQVGILTFDVAKNVTSSKVLNAHGHEVELGDGTFTYG